MKRCSRCGQPLGWPQIDFPPLERRIWELIYNYQPRSEKEALRILDIDSKSFRNALALIREKLPRTIEIKPRPYRVIRLVSEDVYQETLPGVYDPTGSGK